LPSIAKLVHAAADTRLNQLSSADVRHANLTGTRHVLDLAEALGRPEFHYIGTAYVAGDASVLSEQSPGEPLTAGRARNPYEASKIEAEGLVRAYRGRITVMRPSIVVGRSDDGSAYLLEGWYGLFKNVMRIREALGRGNYRDERGIRIARGYKLELPLALSSHDDVALNLIQIDWLTRTEAALIGLPARGQTYNLTHPAPISLGELLSATFEALDLKNVTLVPDDGRWTLSPVKLAMRRMIQREIEHLKPYLQHAPQFVSRNLYRDLGPGWQEPPAITRDFIRLTLRSLAGAGQKPAAEGQSKPEFPLAAE
jgi:nucleoside-diphosphate-sugar epimerase